MGRKALMNLKLQMGISPAVDIDPHELRSMWRRLCLERLHARRAQGIGELPRFRATHQPLIPD